MKKLILILLLNQTIILSQDIFQPNAKLSGLWVLDKSFSDEFNKTKLDETKWWDFNPAWHGRKPSHFARSNVKVKKGLLRLSAKTLDPKKVSIQDKSRGIHIVQSISEKSADVKNRWSPNITGEWDDDVTKYYDS